MVGFIVARIIQTASFEPSNQNEADWLYNGLDCCVTLEVLNNLTPLLDNVSANTYQFSKQLQGPILEMTMRGLKVDQSRRAAILRQCNQDIELVAAQLSRIIREGIGIEWRVQPASWRSTADLRNLFYNVLELKPIKKRRGDGTYTVTTDRDALEKLSANLRAEPLCSRILLLHDLDKKRQRLEAKLDSDGRERTNFNIAGTNTGRLSSSGSDFGTGGNQQNLDRDLREIYISDPGMKFANFDLEQGDARNVGALCWERFLHSHGEEFAGSYLTAAESSDLHTGVARMVWPGLPWATEGDKAAQALFYRNDSYRQISKKLGHATNFDGQARTLSQRAKIDKRTVEAFQRDYFTAFPCVKERIAWIKRELRESSTITTLFGRRRIFFGHPEAGETQREAIAYEPQSMTADEINTGLIRLFSSGRVWLHCQVHDSLLVQYREEEEDEIIPWALEQLKVVLELQRGRKFTVPVEAKVGWNWGDIKYDKQGSVVGNPNGLIKWKGSDGRKKER